ncbi:NAD(P)H-quinone oxidoreductase NdhF [Prochlorococcus marinus XMU1403]|uniref:NAD(P)H-quinone oxidoreductase NdhF n=1 Tax=Prochlorococcus marinus TaxID=1219 RepID=UPI000D89C30F|nr:NAD(P)H-quinone oxidoreductase NdhF [Prochlorococcus marinus]MBW3049938.1 NAD(P)H-quinone oxidoreductase NdhF [Prochlorococcus marinus str. MU1403]PYE00852.1 NAD(P)H-quinone oxidoreductase NdhF [Prochlorococcus marinus XMU1403]
MLLNLTWLIPGIPLFVSFFIALLLLSFSKTMNRLTKPVSYFIIISLTFSEIFSFILFKKNIAGNDLIFRSNFELVVDRSALLFSESIGLIFLLIMLFSVAKLERRTGYVRYFISLGLLSGLVYLFSFSGSLFHNFYDPLISSIDKIGISF